MGPLFDQMKHCRLQTKFKDFIKYWSPNDCSFRLCKHILLEYCTKNNNDIIRSLAYKKRCYFWYILFCNPNSLFQFLYWFHLIFWCGNFVKFHFAQDVLNVWAGKVVRYIWCINYPRRDFNTNECKMYWLFEQLFKVVMY